MTKNRINTGMTMTTPSVNSIAQFGFIGDFNMEAASDRVYSLSSPKNTSGPRKSFQLLVKAKMHTDAITGLEIGMTSFK